MGYHLVSINRTFPMNNKTHRKVDPYSVILYSYILYILLLVIMFIV